MTELGDKLKAARREKGLSLDDLQQITKIQKRYLVAIEEGNYSVMPGKFYTRAFIKQYAEAVDVDSTQLFADFDSEVPESQQEVVEQEQSRARKKAAPLATHSVGGQNSSRNRFFDILPKILIALFILFILFIIWYFVFARDNDKNVATPNDSEQTVKVNDETGSSTRKSDDAKKNDDSAAKKKAADDKAAEKKKAEDKKKADEKDKKMAIEKGQTSGNATSYTVSNADKLSLEISASGGDTWIGVSTAAGANIYNGIVKDGSSSDEIDAKDNKSISIVVGNAPVTTVKVNGEKIELAPTLVKQVLTIKLDDSGSDSSSDSDSSSSSDGENAQ